MLSKRIAYSGLFVALATLIRLGAGGPVTLAAARAPEFSSETAWKWVHNRASFANGEVECRLLPPGLDPRIAIAQPRNPHPIQDPDELPDALRARLQAATFSYSGYDYSSRGYFVIFGGASQPESLHIACRIPSGMTEGQLTSAASGRFEPRSFRPE